MAFGSEMDDLITSSVTMGKEYYEETGHMISSPRRYIIGQILDSTN